MILKSICNAPTFGVLSITVFGGIEAFAITLLWGFNLDPSYMTSKSAWSCGTILSRVSFVLKLYPGLLRKVPLGSAVVSISPSSSTW